MIAAKIKNVSLACRYVYVGSYIRSPFPPFYPMNFVTEGGKVIFVDRMEDMEARAVLGMLIEKSR